MKFALQIRDEEFDKAVEFLGKYYDDKSDILIFDPLTGEPPAGKFVLIAISDIWIPKYADRISGYINKISDIGEIIKTANYLENKDKQGEEDKNKNKDAGEVIKDKLDSIFTEKEELVSEGLAENSNNFLDIAQDEDVQNFFLGTEKPVFVKVEAKKENSNDFSFAFEEGENIIKIEPQKKEEGNDFSLGEEEERGIEEIKIKKETPQKNEIKPKEETVIRTEKEIKRIYLSDSDMSYTVGVSIHIKYSGKIIAIVDEKMFQKYGDFLDENVYIFKSFKDAGNSSLQNYILIITAKDKAQDKEILKYSKNPIAYWEDVNNWVDKLRG
jgi:hypothetical protein